MKTFLKIDFILPSIMLLAVTMASCSKKDDKIFDESASIRFEKSKEELRTDLKSATDGWKLVYFPMTTQNITTVPAANSSFTFLFKFLDDKQVQMKSSLNTARLETSEYGLTMGSTLKLQFTTYSILHDLADAANESPGMGGQAHGGEFEFLAYGKKGNDLIFNTNRYHTELRFERASKEDWQNLDALGSVFLNEFAAPGYVLSASRNGTKLLDSILSFDTKAANKTVSLFTKTTNAAGTVVKTRTKLSGLGYGTKAIVIMPGVVIDNKTFYFFEWDAANKKFLSKIDDVTAEITGTSDPKYL